MPDVFILGFTKCATTSVYDALMSHPNVHNSKVKEPHYHYAKCNGMKYGGPADDHTVKQMFVSIEEKYKALYNSKLMTVDASAMSINDKLTLKLIADKSPNSKVILMLREPVQRAFSAYSHMRRDVREILEFEEAIQQELDGKRADWLPIWQYIDSSRYVDRVKYVREVFGDRLSIFKYESYVEDPYKFMAELALVLGLGEHKWVIKHSNKSGDPKSKIIQKILQRKSFFKSLVVAATPRKALDKIKAHLIERNTGEKQPLDEKAKKLVCSLLSDEMAKIDAKHQDFEILNSLYGDVLRD